MKRFGFQFARWNILPRVQHSSYTHPFRTRKYATYNSFRKQQEINWNKRFQWGASFVVLGGIVYVANLDSAPYSGRNRFMIIGRSIEKRIGNSGYRDMVNQYGRSFLPENHPYHVKVERVIQRLINSSDDFPKDIDWKVHVVDDPKAPPNAFVLPNGKVFVFTSILPLCKDDDGLATVLAHESGHQLARHTAENLSKTPLYMIAAMILYSITYSEALNQVLLNAALKLPASREMEREADYIGLMLMSRACFDPNKAVGFWERMMKFEQSQSSKSMSRLQSFEFLSTHPLSSHRVELIKEWLPEANALRDRNGCDHDTQFGDFVRQWMG